MLDTCIRKSQCVFICLGAGVCVRGLYWDGCRIKYQQVCEGSIIILVFSHSFCRFWSPASWGLRTLQATVASPACCPRGKQQCSVCGHGAFTQQRLQWAKSPHCKASTSRIQPHRLVPLLNLALLNRSSATIGLLRKEISNSYLNSQSKCNNEVTTTFMMQLQWLLSVWGFHWFL